MFKATYIKRYLYLAAKVGRQLSIKAHRDELFPYDCGIGENRGNQLHIWLSLSAN